MNTSPLTRIPSATALSAAVAASLLLVACAATPLSPEGSAEVRTKLTQLQSDPNLATRAPIALREAEAAVQVAEQPLADDAALGAHRVYMADRKVDIAVARASTRYAEDQRAALGAARDRERLDARTREADTARASAADTAREAAQQADELQRQIDMLQAEATDRGLVVTLGHVLFESGQADLKAGATGNLDKLVAFLNKYPDRTAKIEGHTDNVGSNDANQALSRRRAESVKSYLTQKGIGAQRLAASGYGENLPLADNVSGSGRQRNRRVEVIIENLPLPRASMTSGSISHE